MKLQDKVVLVTGATGAIGSKIVQAFAARAAQVMATDVCLSEEGQSELTAAVADLPGLIDFWQLDVTDIDSVRAVCKAIVEKYGRIDVLVNNAGITRDSLIVRMKPADWQQVLQVNLTGAFYMLKEVARHMMRQRRGAIVNVTSVAGQAGNSGQANYAAAKAGLIGLTKTAALELASRNIVVNAVAPGFIAVGMTEALPENVKKEYIKRIPLGRAGTAEEVAEAICFLAESEYITGQVLAVNGGLYL